MRVIFFEGQQTKKYFIRNESGFTDQILHSQSHCKDFSGGIDVCRPGHYRLVHRSDLF